MDLLDYTDYEDFKQQTGMQCKEAIEFLLDELSRLKK